MQEDVTNVAGRVGAASQAERGVPSIQGAPRTKAVVTTSQAVDDAVELIHRLEQGGVGSSFGVDGAEGVSTFSPPNVAMDHLMMRVFQSTGGQPEAMVLCLRQLLENALDKLAAQLK